MKSKLSKSSIPRDFNIKITLPKLVLKISGSVLSSNSFSYDHAVYSRKHFPGATRPALPVL